MDSLEYRLTRVLKCLLMHAFWPVQVICLIISIITIAITLYAELATYLPGAGPSPRMVVSRVLTAPVGKIQATTAGKCSVRRWLVEP